MRLIEQALTNAMPGVDPDVQIRVAVALQHVWHASLMGWVNGWSDAATVGRDLESAARLLLEGR